MCSLSRTVGDSKPSIFLVSLLGTNLGDALERCAKRSVHCELGHLRWSKTQLFIERYMLQSVVHTIWKERNRRRHEEGFVPVVLLIKRLDKNMRN